MKILKEKQFLEFSGFRPEKTGLTSGYIWASGKVEGHFPRIKFFRGSFTSGESVSIKISKPPLVVEKASSFKLTSREKKEIFAFIELNYDSLLHYWETGSEMFTDTRVAWERKIKKI